MTTKTITLFGKEADFFLNHDVTIWHIEKIDRERSAVEITFEGVEK